MYFSLISCRISNSILREALKIGERLFFGNFHSRNNTFLFVIKSLKKYPQYPIIPSGQPSNEIMNWFVWLVMLEYDWGELVLSECKLKLFSYIIFLYYDHIVDQQNVLFYLEFLIAWLWSNWSSTLLSLPHIIMGVLRGISTEVL